MVSKQRREEKDRVFQSSNRSLGVVMPQKEKNHHWTEEEEEIAKIVLKEGLGTKQIAAEKFPNLKYSSVKAKVERTKNEQILSKGPNSRGIFLLVSLY